MKYNFYFVYIQVSKVYDWIIMSKTVLNKNGDKSKSEQLMLTFITMESAGSDLLS